MPAGFFRTMAVALALAFAGCSASSASSTTTPPPSIDGLPSAPAMTNVVTTVHGDTVAVSFDPVDGAADYRIYVAPPAGSIMAGTPFAIENGVFRCAGGREAPAVPADGAAQVASGFVSTQSKGNVVGFNRAASDDILGYVATAAAAGLTPVWAMGDPAGDADNSCFFQRWTESRVKQYVATQAQHDALAAAGWRDDGIVFYVPASGAAGTTVVQTATTNVPNTPEQVRLYFASALEVASRAALKPATAFSVFSAAGTGLQPLYRTYYANGCGRSHDELSVGLARFNRALMQGNSPVEKLHWAGLTAATTLVIEALDKPCPYQGHLSPQAVPAEAPHPRFFTMAELAADEAHGQVFVNGQGDPSNQPNAIARAVVQVSPQPLEPMDFSDDFPAGNPKLASINPMDWPGTSTYDHFNSFRFDSPGYDLSLYTLDVFNGLPVSAFGQMLGEFWVSFADFASDTNGKFRMTPKQHATLSASGFLHVMEEVDIFTTDRRYPQILVSTQPAPVQDTLTSGSTVIVQTFGQWPPRIDVELCDHRTWDVNNQCPRFDVDPISFSASTPVSGLLPPHAEIGDWVGGDRRVRFDLYLSSAQAYVFFEGQPYACVNLPQTGGIPAGDVTVTFGDVLYHSGVDVPSPPYVFHGTRLQTESERHFDAIGFKSGVPAPAWDETRFPCTSTVVE